MRIGVRGKTGNEGWCYNDNVNDPQMKAESYVIHADICTLSAAELAKYHITFKKIPRDITRF